MEPARDTLIIACYGGYAAVRSGIGLAVLRDFSVDEILGVCDGVKVRRLGLKKP